MLFEHEACPFDWTDRDLAALERLNRSLGMPILTATIGRGGRRELKAAQHVGVVRFGSRTVQILPKIYRHGGVAREEATRNLLHLLAHAGQIPVREHALTPLLRRDSDWFEILTRLFADHLQNEWQRGIIRGYERREETLPTLRGQWRITEQLRRPERRHLFAVAYDEFTPDNSLNRVFRFVVERLWGLTRDSDNRRQLGLLREWMEDVALLPTVSAADATPVLLTRLHQSYTPLLNLARLFLDGGALQLSAGDQTTFAFVFDMNQLFEAFVIGFLTRHRAALLPPSLESCEMLPQSQNATRFLAHRAHKSVFRLKPDLAFRDTDGAFPLLLDAKYKRLNAADAALGIAQADFYQMHAYAHRYACPRVLLLYPQTGEMPAPLRACFTLDGGQRIEAATIDLRVELGKPSGIQQLMTEFKSILEDIHA